MGLQDKLYEDNLNRLMEKAKGREILNLRETADILGVRDTRTVKRRYPFSEGYISLATLARCLTPTEGELKLVSSAAVRKGGSAEVN